jgi:hypothetical protein
MLYEEVIRVLQIIFPVFIGYLSLAAAHVSRGISPGRLATRDSEFASRQITQLVLRGPIYVVGLCLIVLTAAFWISNIPSARPGNGMSLDNFCWFLSLLMGLLAASSALIIARLFPSMRRT